MQHFRKRLENTVKKHGAEKLAQMTGYKIHVINQIIRGYFKPHKKFVSRTIKAMDALAWDEPLKDVIETTLEETALSQTKLAELIEMPVSTLNRVIRNGIKLKNEYKSAKYASKCKEIQETHGRKRPGRGKPVVELAKRKRNTKIMLNASECKDKIIQELETIKTELQKMINKLTDMGNKETLPDGNISGHALDSGEDERPQPTGVQKPVTGRASTGSRKGE